MKKADNVKTKWFPATLTLLVLALPAWAQAQQSSLEERLRTELRNTTQQLRDLQSRQAGLEAARSNAEVQRDAARAQVAKLQARLDAVEGNLASQQRSSQARIAASRERAQQMRDAYDELLTLAKGKETERLTLQKALQQRTAELQTCVSRNEEMYMAGKEILSAYESLGAGSLFKMRQPLATSSRVEFENRAQEMGDRLYNAQVGVVRSDQDGNAGAAENDG